MLSRDQLLYLFDRFASLTSQPEVKQGIADAVDDKQTLQSSFDKDKNASPEIPWYWLLNLKGHKTAADIFPTRIWRWHNFLIQSKEVKTFSGDFTARGDRVYVV
ncbi:plant/protein [Perilla frutescens var. frutescens]|nr:plant/protein [Perilla frutescens var. frutescens]